MINLNSISVKNVDGRVFLAQNKGYDLIFINLPSPSTILLNRFYTKEFFIQVYKALNREGILILVLPGSEAYMGEELTLLNACIYQTLKSIFSDVYIIPGDSNIFLASNSKIASLTEILHRYDERRIKGLSKEHIVYKLDQRRVEWFLNSIDVNSNINEDFHPSAVFYSLWLWSAKFSPYALWFFKIVNSLRLETLLLLSTALLSTFIVKRRTRESAITMTIFTTGFYGMVTALILIIALQSLYGYIYHLIGLLISSFMVGLWVGGAKIKASSILKIELGILIYCSTMVLLFANSLLFLPLIIVLNFLAGVLVGVEFAVANEVYLKMGLQLEKSAGVLYASDLLGAWLGALTVCIILIPSLGILQTCVFLASLKLLGLILLFYFYQKDSIK